MDCQAVREDLGAYAIGALDAPEAAVVRQHVAGCDECAVYARQFGDLSHTLALAVPLYRAPRRLRDSVMAATLPARRFAFPRFAVESPWWSAAAAGLAALALGAVVWAGLMSGEVSELRSDNRRLASLLESGAQERQALTAQLAGLREREEKNASRIGEQAKMISLAFDPEVISWQMEGTGLAPDAQCHYVWSAYESMGLLSCSKLPDRVARTYQMWITRGDRTVAVGSFLPEADGSANALVRLPADAPSGQVSRMWVTLEWAGTTPTTPGSDVVLVRAEAGRQ